MENIKLIYEYIEDVKVNIYQNKPVEIKIMKEKINSDVLFYIAQRIKYLLKFRSKKLKIIFNFKNLHFADKITYLILDMIIYDIMKRTKFEICLCCENRFEANLQNFGFTNTALFKSTKKCLINRIEFINNYERKFFSNNVCYRRILDKDTLRKKDTPSIIGTDLGYILKELIDDEEWIDSVVEMVSELIDNVASHTESGCLIDINFDNNIKLNNKKGIAINVSIINISENKLSDKVKLNIKENLYDKKDKIYSKIYEAYNNHKNLFNEYYNEEHFFLITTFQKHVTSRSYKSGNSGTGLTRLIQNIIGRSKDDYSYVLSGDTILIFKEEFLEMERDGFIGFNKEKDYLTNAPDKMTINNSGLYIPGTIYNLLLIKEK